MHLSHLPESSNGARAQWARTPSIHFIIAVEFKTNQIYQNTKMKSKALYACKPIPKNSPEKRIVEFNELVRQCSQINVSSANPDYEIRVGYPPYKTATTCGGGHGIRAVCTSCLWGYCQMRDCCGSIKTFSGYTGICCECAKCPNRKDCTIYHRDLNADKRMEDGLSKFSTVNKIAPSVASTETPAAIAVPQMLALHQVSCPPSFYLLAITQ